MKRALFVLLAAAFVVPMTLVGQAQDSNTALQDFSKTLNSNGVTLSVVLMNDKTIDVLFQAPTKFAMRARARMATMVYIQGTPGRDVEFKTEFTIQQDGEPIVGKAVNIKNFDNMKVAKGQRIDGVVEFPTKIDLTKPFRIANGKDTVEFRLSASLVKSLSS